MIEISKLQPHPRNQEFFDDIPKERWDDFIKSIVRRGVVEAIVVTQDLLIVSGHQRVRACKEIGILEIPCRITHYPEEDEKLHIPKEDMILEDLICTNIMQRGVGNVNPMKMARCIRELERIYGIKNGGNNFRGNQYIRADRSNADTYKKTQADLAKQIGIDQRQLQNYKKLNELIPELQSLVETGMLKSTTAYKIWAKLPQDEQEKFFNDIGQEKIKQLTQKKTEQIISEKKQIDEKKLSESKIYNTLKNQNKIQQRKPISNQVLKSLAIRSKGFCEICGWGGQGLENILVNHHIQKYSDTKDNSLNNLIMICPNCHGMIHTLENCNDNNIKNNILYHLNVEVSEKIQFYTKELTNKKMCQSIY
ncbi:HNH endonuclease [Clostridium botulinum]|nr:HNH endonuclease [Clostridium botulinum]